jgi:hypothetical protein
LKAFVSGFIVLSERELPVYRRSWLRELHESLAAPLTPALELLQHRRSYQSILADHVDNINKTRGIFIVWNVQIIA